MTDVSPTVSFATHAALTKEALVRVKSLVDLQFASRLFRKDDTLWGEAAQQDASQRLNWVDSPFHSDKIFAQSADIKDRLLNASISEVLLCGMGGSSLGAELLSDRGGGRLRVLDSTHPDDVRAALEGIEHKFVVISSKSGTTLETRCHLLAVEQALESQDILSSSRICVVTDPGSELDNYAQQRGYELVTADPNLGGRFSIFAAYGIVPAVLAGASVATFLQEAREALPTLSTDSEVNPALLLAALAVENAAAMPLLRNDFNAPFAAWIEQLVAESTGKRGKGVLPVLMGKEMANGSQVDFFSLNGPFGAQILAWEVATTAMAWLLEVNPFDQPDVEQAKRAARLQLAAGLDMVKWSPTTSAQGVLERISSHVQKNSYVVIQDFTDNTKHSVADAVQQALREHLEVPVTVNRGPRYLHSSGQLHKGGPRQGIYLQLLPRLDRDLDIPGEDFTFGQILFAQANGDADALTATSQPVFQLQISMSELLIELKNLT